MALLIYSFLLLHKTFTTYRIYPFTILITQFFIISVPQTLKASKFNSLSHSSLTFQLNRTSINLLNFWTLLNKLQKLSFIHIPILGFQSSYRIFSTQLNTYTSQWSNQQHQFRFLIFGYYPWKPRKIWNFYHIRPYMCSNILPIVSSIG